MQFTKNGFGKSKSGFTLIELLAALFIGSAVLSLIAVKTTSCLTWSKKKAAYKDLASLNSAVETYKAEYGSLPGNGNNQRHNQIVLNALTKNGLFVSAKLKLSKLKSIGSGMKFRFTEYLGMKAPIVADNNSDGLIASWISKISSSQIKFEVE